MGGEIILASILSDLFKEIHAFILVIIVPANQTTLSKLHRLSHPIICRKLLLLLGWIMHNILSVKCCRGLLLVPIVSFKKGDNLVDFYIPIFIRQDCLEINYSHRLFRILIYITIFVM